MLDCIQMVQLKKHSSEYVQYLKSFRTLQKCKQKSTLRIAFTQVNKNYPTLVVSVVISSMLSIQITW